ncbi:MAG: lactate utilization protein, partial [Gammaproteobacteria bacterium]|nr:lactate utilization protein [Gammaproteobacteria bacterium]
DTAALSSAYAAVAENGTLVLLSDKATPTSHNFLPDDHLVVVQVPKVFRYLEDVWEELRTGRGIPRAVNLITGPSKTADVEQTIQYGAHGPRRLHVILVDE